MASVLAALVAELAAGRITRDRSDATARAGHAGDRAAGHVCGVAGRVDRRDLAIRRQGPGWYWNTIRMGEHTGTHFDAPVHWITGRDLPNNTTDTIPAGRFIGPACVIDITAEVDANEDYLLDVAALERWEAKHGAGAARRMGAAQNRMEQALERLRVFERARRWAAWSGIRSSDVAAARGRARRARRGCGDDRHRRGPGGPIRPAVSRITTSCTATASSAWRACAISIDCRRRARW